MKNKKLYYHGTDIDMKLGDKITYKSWWFFEKLATVVYVPFQSKPNKAFGDDTWVLEFDNTKEFLQTAFFPSYDKYTFKNIKFIKRGSELGIQADDEFH